MCAFRRPTKFEFSYTGVRARNLDTSIAFYRDHLGMELISRAEIPETRGAVAALRSVEGGLEIYEAPAA